MKKIALLLLAMVALGAQEPVFVSLGSTCGPAFILRTAGLRKAAFPFDWILSVDNEKLLEILDEDFLKFIDEEYLVPDCYIKPYSEGNALYHTGYHLEFLHEGAWTANYSTNMEKLRSKYGKRIERFRDLRTHTGKVFFIRTCWRDGDNDAVHFKCPENLEISKPDALRLMAALRRFFPHLDFTLIVINFDENPSEVLTAAKFSENGIEIRLGLVDFLEPLQSYLTKLY